jgi:hypothetical protein
MYSCGSYTRDKEVLLGLADVKLERIHVAAKAAVQSPKTENLAPATGDFLHARGVLQRDAGDFTTKRKGESLA